MARQERSVGTVGLPPFFHPGELLDGKYHVEEVLGAGAMGIVVRARHLELGSEVAVKFLRSELFDDRNVVSRFLQESQLAARIRSPHVARVIDAGTIENGSPYLIMELLEGRDMARLIEEDGPIDIGFAVGLALQACEGLAAAHAAGVVHRDVKPGNLFVCEGADHDPVLKLLDFGISKLEASHERRDLTRPVLPVGSPLYMAPEQMMGARDVDARADLWSLGVVLYELLTGTLPFTAANLPELTTKILHADPPRLRDARPDAPLALQEIIVRLLRRRRDERYVDAAELAADLSRLAGPAGEVSARRTARILHGVSAVDASEPPSQRTHVHDLPTELALPLTNVRPRLRSSSRPRLLLAAAMLVLGFALGAGLLFTRAWIADENAMQAQSSLRVSGVRERVTIRAALPSGDESARLPGASATIVHKRPSVVLKPRAVAKVPIAPIQSAERLPQLPLATEPVADDLLADSRSMLDDRL